MADEDALRRMINSIEMTIPDDGQGPPDLEAIKEKTVTKRRSTKKLFVQKLVTEAYIYTDFQGKGVGQVTYQKVFILGEMTEAKLKRLMAAERQAIDEDG